MSRFRSSEVTTRTRGSTKRSKSNGINPEPILPNPSTTMFPENPASHPLDQPLPASSWTTSPSSSIRPPLPKVLDDVPVDHATRSSRRGREAVAEGQVHGPVDLLVEVRVSACSRVIPGLQPIPSSPRRRAPSSVSSISSRKASFVSAEASTTRPPSKRSRTPLTSRPRDGRKLGEHDLALGRVLDRAAEELAARHVRAGAAGVHLARPAGDRRAGDPCSRRRSAPRRRASNRSA